MHLKKSDFDSDDNYYNFKRELQTSFKILWQSRMRLNNFRQEHLVIGVDKAIEIMRNIVFDDD
jgi:hypothetical protein